MKHTIGVLGGMGPLATVDFMGKLVRLTPATHDQEHIPLLVYSQPRIPDRSEHILNGSESPLPAMLEAIQALSSAGVGCIAIPCHTAHYWYRELQSSTTTRIFNMVEIALGMLAGQTNVRRVGLLATAGAIRAGVYQRPMVEHGLEMVVPDQDVQGKVAEVIALVKAGRLDCSTHLLEQAIAALLDRGCDRVLLGCTELPILVDSIAPALHAKCLDTTAALAQACIDWYRQQTGLPD